MLPHLEDLEMKNRMFVALLLAGVLALPALAQNQLPPRKTNPPLAASTTGASGKPALQPDTHEGFWGKINPFARKKYVQRQTAPIRDRVNELDELTSSNTQDDQGHRLARYRRHPPGFHQSQRSRPARH